MHNGITAESLHFGSIEARGFYLSLDKKLILRLESLQLTPLLETPDSKEHSDLGEVLHWIKNTKMLLGYFQEVHFKEVQLGENRGSLLYQDDLYWLDLPELSTIIELDEMKGHVLARIHEILYKPYGARFQGEADYAVLKNRLTFQGSLEMNGAPRINLRGESDFETIRLSGDSEAFESLRFIENLATIENPTIRAWLYENIDSAGMRLDSFSFESRLSEEALLESLQKRLKARLEIAQAKVRYHPSAPAALTEGVSVIYDGEVYFELHKPRHEGIGLEGSHVALRDLWGEKPHLELLLQSQNARLDERIHAILRAYEINVPLVQLSGETSAKLLLRVDFNSEEVHTQGYFEAQESRFKLEGMEFSAPLARVKLEDSLVSILPRTRVKIKDLLEGELALAIDTARQSMEGEANLAWLAVGEKGEILHLKNRQVPLSADFSGKEVKIALPSLRSKLFLGGAVQRIEVEELAALYRDSKLLQEHSIPRGWLKLASEDMERFSLEARLEGLSYPLSSLEGAPVEMLELRGSVAPHRLYLASKDERLRLSQERENLKLYLKGYAINLEGKAPLQGTQGAVEIEAEESHLLFGERRIMADWLKATLGKKGEFKAELGYQKGVLKASMQPDKRLKIEARQFPDRFVNALLAKEVVSGGSFDLIGDYHQKIFNGKALMRNTKLQNLNSLQNLVALIDSLPSLVMFRAPGFSSKGYIVKQGEVRFGINSDYVVLERFKLEGSSMDSEGFGIMELATQELDFELRLRTLKSLSTMVSNIPLLGHIILGKDGSISTNVTIKGSLENPIVKTSLAKDALQAPSNILERLLKTPLRILGNE